MLIYKYQLNKIFISLINKRLCSKGLKCIYLITFQIKINHNYFYIIHIC